MPVAPLVAPRVTPRVARGGAADPHGINADLHCHSNVSDGTLSPAELAERARAQGVQLWALTDHDELGGLRAAGEAARAAGLEFVPGVEISVTWAKETLHIVGLNVDPDSAELGAGLAEVRSGRERRARAIAAELDGAGIPGAYEGALRLCGNPRLLSRTHFARYIVECGVRGDVHAVFSDFLVSGRPGYVPMQWATLTQAVTWIRAAGGSAVIAHPGRYRLSALEMSALLDEFRELGGAAIEVVTGSHTVDQYRQYARLSRDYGLKASRGSDFHSPGESRIDLGALPPLPDSVVPVWHDWF